MLTVVYMSVG